MALVRRLLSVLLTSLAACGSLKSAPVAEDSGAEDAAVPEDSAPPTDDAMDSGSTEAEVDAAVVHFVFVSTAKTAGDFGGSTNDPYLSADATCRAEAQAIGLEGDFAAWLSYQEPGGTAHDAVDRLPNVAYYLPGDRLEAGAPIMIASSLAELVASGPSQPLDRVANGTQVPSDENSYVAWVWTGTKGDGTVDTQTCSNWTSASGTNAGITGNARQIPAHTQTDWTTLDGRTCDVPRRFYCFQK